MPKSIRYVNVGSVTVPVPGRRLMSEPLVPETKPLLVEIPTMELYFDLVVTNRSAYKAHNPLRTGINGRFAQINFAANTRVDLRVTVTRSQCTRPNCWLCEEDWSGVALDAAARAACYSAGCCCFSATCHDPSCCTDSSREEKRLGYVEDDTPLVLPGSTLVREKCDS